MASSVLRSGTGRGEVPLKEWGPAPEHSRNRLCLWHGASIYGPPPEAPSPGADMPSSEDLAEYNDVDKTCLGDERIIQVENIEFPLVLFRALHPILTQQHLLLWHRKLTTHFATLTMQTFKSQTCPAVSQTQY